MPLYHNVHLFANDAARDGLRRLVDLSTRLAENMPEGEETQAACLQDIVAEAGAQIASGQLRLSDDFAETDPVIRLYKAPVGKGRVKLQLFPLEEGDSHPPHAHYNLISCQIVLRGRVRMREYSLLRRLAGDELEIAEEPVRQLHPGDGVFTLQRRNNIHWQQGLEPGTILLNMNWQGFFSDNPMSPEQAMHGRCYIDWDRARAAEEPGRIIVPEVVGN